MAQWNSDQLESALQQRGWFINRRSINHAFQFELNDQVKINLYETGSITYGGPESDFKTKVRNFVEKGPADTQLNEDDTSGNIELEERQTETEPRIFVVYGHDIDAREELELILRRVRTNPIILQNIPGKGDTLIEKLESLTDADFACVLITPDDVGAKQEKERHLRPRARQNVVLELGMVLSRLGRSRVAILVKGSDIEKPSDIDGLIYISFQEKVSEAATELGASLQDAGFNINVRDLLGS